VNVISAATSQSPKASLRHVSIRRTRIFLFRRRARAATHFFRRAMLLRLFFQIKAPQSATGGGLFCAFAKKKKLLTLHLCKVLNAICLRTHLLSFKIILEK